MIESEEIMIEKKIYKKLGIKSSAEKFFHELDISTPKLVINFKNVEFMSRSFAQEYIYQRNNLTIEVEEINMNEFVKCMLDTASKDY